MNAVSPEHTMPSERQASCHEYALVSPTGSHAILMRQKLIYCPVEGTALEQCLSFQKRPYIV